MSESGLLGSLQRARNAADAVRVGTEKARSEAALDPANSPPVILAKATTKIVLDSIPMDSPLLKEALIKKAGDMVASHQTGTRPLPTPSGETSYQKRQK